MAPWRARHRDGETIDGSVPLVLVVHDDHDGCELLVRLIDGAGFATTRAHDFNEFARAVSEPPLPQGVVLDMTAGGVAGNLQMLDALRRHPNPAVSTMRVVLVASGGSNAVMSWQAGIDELLRRPFHARDLLGAVTAAMHRPEAHRVDYRLRQLEHAVGRAPR